MTWVEIFAVLVVSHLAGDFVLQTDWQAKHKFGGLRGQSVARRALLAHLATYGMACIPALVWIGLEEGVGAVAAVAAIVIGLHLVQDDGRLLRGYMRRVKHTDARPGDLVFMLVDQSLHVLLLFAAAVVAVV
jgi:Protein of unknown function (DUF3307)